MFREVTEIVDGIDNKSFKNISIRLLIRYLTRFFGYRNSSFILSWLLLISKKVLRIQKYSFSIYIIQINIFRNNCLFLMKRRDFVNHQIEKRKWSNYVIQNSKNIIAVNNAKDYLKLLYDYGLYEFGLEAVQKISLKKIYLFGPKTENLSPHHDCVIILTKPVSQDISKFRSSILFLNSYYFNNTVANNIELQENLLNKYDKIYVSCAHSNLREGFVRINPMIEFAGGHLSGAMALGRVLAFLLKGYSFDSCIIEGYDFYLSSKLYSSNYPSGLRLSNGNFDEKNVCWSLMDHDALFNFLYVKKACERIKLVESENFAKIIKMSGEEYMNKLFSFRDFSKL